MHRREIEFDSQARCIFVTDRIFCHGAHVVEGFWHFSEACEVTRNGPIIRAANLQQQLSLTLPHSVDEIFIACGDEQRPAGWVSRAFDTKLPAPTVAWKKRILGTACFVSRIDIG